VGHIPSRIILNIFSSLTAVRALLGPYTQAVLEDAISDSLSSTLAQPFESIKFSKELRAEKENTLE